MDAAQPVAARGRQGRHTADGLDHGGLAQFTERVETDLGEREGPRSGPVTGPVPRRLPPGPDQMASRLPERLDQGHAGHVVARVLEVAGVVAVHAHEVPPRGGRPVDGQQDVLLPLPSDLGGVEHAGLRAGHVGRRTATAGRGGAPVAQQPVQLGADREQPYRHPCAAAAAGLHPRLEARSDPVPGRVGLGHEAAVEHERERLASHHQCTGVHEVEVEVAEDEAVGQRDVVEAVRGVDGRLPDGLHQQQRVTAALRVRLVERVVAGPLRGDPYPVAVAAAAVGEEDLGHRGAVDQGTRDRPVEGQGAVPGRGSRRRLPGQARQVGAGDRAGRE